MSAPDAGSRASDSAPRDFRFSGGCSSLRRLAGRRAALLSASSSLSLPEELQRKRGGTRQLTLQKENILKRYF